MLARDQYFGRCETAHLRACSIGPYGDSAARKRRIVGVVPSPKVNSKKLEEEADAARAIAHAPDTALRCSDPERESMPIAGGARKTPL